MDVARALSGVYGADVRSTDLKPSQVQRLARVIRKHHAWLEALSGRCGQKRFPADDPVKVAADAALAAAAKLRDAVNALGQHANVDR